MLFQTMHARMVMRVMQRNCGGTFSRRKDEKRRGNRRDIPRHATLLVGRAPRVASLRVGSSFALHQCTEQRKFFCLPENHYLMHLHELLFYEIIFRVRTDVCNTRLPRMCDILYVASLTSLLVNTQSRKSRLEKPKRS